MRPCPVEVAKRVSVSINKVFSHVMSYGLDASKLILMRGFDSAETCAICRYSCLTASACLDAFQWIYGSCLAYAHVHHP